MNSYDELIVAIKSLSEKSVFDYLFAIGPIVLSLIAIIISIYTTEKQNRIALFEKRCNVLETIKRIIGFAKRVADIEDICISDKQQDGKLLALEIKSHQVCEAYNFIFGTNLDFKKRLGEKPSIRTSVYALQKNLMMTKFLFFPEIDDLLFDLCEAMEQYMVLTVSPCDNSLPKKQFCEKCSELETKWLPKLEKKTQITSGIFFVRR